MKIPLASKLPNIGTNIFTEMSQLANEYNAVNLSQGFPDFDVDKQLFEYAYKAMNSQMNQYAPMAGLLSLREEISQKYNDLYGQYYHPDSEITITSGGSEGIFSTISALVRAGDEVIVFEPAYDLYRPVVELNGGIVKSLVLSYPDFRIDWMEFKSLISHKTRLVIINNPNNPTTKLLDHQDLLQMQEIIESLDIFVLSDEVYEHIVFDKLTFNSICTLEKLKNRSIIVASFGKLLHTTGWKIGYCLAPNDIMQEIRKVHQFNTFSVHTPSQFAISVLLKDPSIYLELADFFERKRNLFFDGLSQTRFLPIQSSGTYFMLADYSNITDLDDKEFAKMMIRENGVASIPLSAFYQKSNDSKLVRFCFAKKDETLENALEKLIKI